MNIMISDINDIFVKSVFLKPTHPVLNISHFIFFPCHNLDTLFFWETF